MSGRENLTRIRNIGIAAHIDAGKTTLSERILYFAGKIHRMGEVHDGEAVMDWMPQERERGITIMSAATTIRWKDHRVNLIDTPGHVDFTAEVERSLRVLDGMVALFCAVGGVEPQSETVWRQADKYEIPVIAFINKMDRDGADYFRVVREMEKHLGARAVPVVVPAIASGAFRGVIDLIDQTAMLYTSGETDEQEKELPVPAEYYEFVVSCRERLIEMVCEGDEALFQKYVDGEEITPDEIRSALRRATLERRLVPVLCGSAFKNRGVKRLLDAVLDFLPSPADMATRVAKELLLARSGEAVTGESPTAALAFKVIVDKHMGRAVFVRVYSGSLSKGVELFNPNRGKMERVGRLMEVHANRREMTDEIPCGAIGLVTGLEETFTGDTLSDPRHPVVLGSIEFPSPVISLKVLPTSVEDRLRLAGSIARLAEEDPTFHVGHGEGEGEMVISGMGELHLDVLLDRLKREYGVTVEVGPPEVAYRETVGKEVEVNYRHVKQSGGRGQFAHVVLRVSPAEPGSGFSFEERIKGGAVPIEYIPAIERGIRDVLAEGVLAGYPIVDVKAVLVDGSFHEVDSSDMAFRTAARKAFKKAFLDAAPRLLEPIMAAYVNCPEALAGSVSGDLCSRRGRIQGMDIRDGSARIQALVPIGEMLGYATTIRTLTSGRGGFQLTFDSYKVVPENLARAIVEDRIAPPGKTAERG